MNQNSKQRLLQLKFEWNRLQAEYWNVVLDSHEAVDDFGQWLIENQNTISNIPLLGYAFSLGQGLSDILVPGDYYLKDQEDIDEWQSRMLTSTGITVGTIMTAGLLGLDGSETSMLEAGTKVQNTLNQASNWISDTVNKLFKKGTSNAAIEGAAGQTTKLYRVMSEGEYNSLVKNGQFTQYDKAMETKWFATNADDAAKWGKQFYPNGNYKMVEIEVPKDSLSQMYNVNKLDGIGPAYNAERDFINSVIKSFKEVTR